MRVLKVYELILIPVIILWGSGGVVGQITAPNANSSMPTAYTNYTPDDQIYIFCSPDAQGNPVTGSLTATPGSGTPGWTFVWGEYNSSTQSYTTIQTDNNVPSSTITGLASGGYNVVITDGNGNTECYQTWVWVINTNINLTPISAGCSPFNLNASIVANNNFTYYDPPPPAFIIDQNTSISVCFNANHTWVSDLGFFLIGPASCGSPILPLAPHPQAINSGNGCCCNSGNNVSNLCFSTANTNMLSVCLAGTPLSGNYGIYGQGSANNYSANQNNWSPLYGCNATEGGWKVQIWDCIGADVGALTNATITFSGTGSCGPSSITYTSGNISATINDNSCSTSSASTYTVPFAPTATHNLTSTYTYQWSANPVVTIPGSTSSLTPTIDPAPSQDTWFYLTVTTNNGCITKDSVFFDYVGTDATIDSVGPFCLDDPAVTLTAANPGGTWTGNGVNSGGTFTPSVAGPGIHSIVYTTPGNCPDTDTLDIVVSEITATYVITDPLCNGICDGEVVITPAGGAAPYQYSLDNGSTFQASATFSGLCAGNYNVVITDAGNCTFTDQVTLTDPPAMGITSNYTSSTCGLCDGTITLSGSGGDGNYQYSIDNGVTFQASGNFNSICQGTYDVIVEDGAGCQVTDQVIVDEVGGITITNVALTDASCNGVCDAEINITASVAGQFSIDNGSTWQASGMFPSLCAGTYYIQVQDNAYGCMAYDTVMLTEPGATTINTVGVGPNCNGACDGTIDITINGGTAPMQYSIDNGSTFQASGSFTGVCAGAYNILVLDANSCPSIDQVTLTDPPVLSLSATSGPASCGVCDGTVNITANGGDGGPYQYSVDNGVTFQALSSFSGICTGVQNLVVQDASGCQATGTVNVGVLSGPSISGIVPTDATCNGVCDGAISITGNSIAQYSIDNGVTWQVSGNFTGLCAGTYYIVVEDANGCQVMETTLVTEPSAVTLSSTYSDVTCNGACDGSIVLTAAGGTPSYTYSITNGSGLQVSSNFSDLCAGTYAIAAADANMCMATGSVTINEPTPLMLTLNITNPSCFGDCNGSIVAYTTGSVPLYQYNWSTGDADDHANDLCDGTYSLTVTDAAGCSIDSSGIVITEPAPMAVDNVIVTDEICHGDCMGTIEIQAANASLYSIDGGVNFTSSPLFSQLCAGHYDIAVQSSAGCSATSSADIARPIQVVARFFADPEVTTEIEPMIDFYNNSTGASSYMWDFGNGFVSLDTNPSYDFNNGETGTYEVCLTAINNAGCMDTICHTVIINELFTIYVPNAFTPNEDHTNNVFLPVVDGEVPGSYEFRVFNRWGEEIFFTTDKTEGWDGTIATTPVPNGVYLWKVLVRPASKPDLQEYIGKVSLIR